MMRNRASPRRGNPRRSRPGVEGLEARALLTSSGVTIYHNDPSGSGLNPAETTLTPKNVNATTFGKLFSSGLDGFAFAQPLYVAGVNVTTGSSPGVHNVVYVATEHDSVYAFDADSGALLWKDSLLHAIHGGTVSTVPTGQNIITQLGPEEGITSTPVIDTGTGTIYVVATTHEVVGTDNHYIYQLHALDLGSGAEKLGGPAVIADTTFNGPGYIYVSGPSVPGSGGGSVGGIITFNAQRANQRTALAEAGGTIYIAFASSGEGTDEHGWLLGYNAATLALSAVFNTTPNGGEGNIWSGGGGISVDAQGNLFVTAGNGTFDGSNGSDPTMDAGGPGPITGLNTQGFPAEGDYGDTLLKLAPDPTTTPAHPGLNGWGLKVVDYFTPKQEAYLDAADLDFGSHEVVLLPPSAGSPAHPNLAVVAGKEGTLYLLDLNNLGRFGTTTDNVVQELKGAFAISFTSPAVFNGAFSYAPSGGHLERFTVANAAFVPVPGLVSPDTFVYRGAPPSISANGTSNGIVWALDFQTNQLRAYDATNPANELYTSAQAANGRDALPGNVTTFSTPTIVNGKVYVATNSGLVAFGILPPGPILPLAPNPSPFGSHNPDIQTAEVTGLYNLILGRAPDTPSLAYWVAALKAGYPLQQFSSYLLHSAEYDTHLVAAYYRTYLNVNASVADINAWVGLMQNGLTAGQVTYYFMTTPEFNALHPDNPSFVQALYQGFLGRPAAPSEVSAWNSVLTSGTTRGQAVLAFEHYTLSQQYQVEGLYSVFLASPATPSGLTFYVNVLQAGLPLADVASFFAASSEFLARAAATVG